MLREPINRREFLKASGIATLTARGILGERSLSAQDSVPNSSGTRSPLLKAPALACDCHHHIYDAQFPFSQPAARIVANSRVSDYRLFQRRIGTARNVIVTPTPFPASLQDNQVTLDAIAQFGANARGVAIISPAITDADLRTLDKGGIRGIRFNLTSPTASAALPDMSMIEPLAKRVNDLGWHVQLNIAADHIVAAEDLLKRLPSALVFDHMGHMPQPVGSNHAAFKVIHRLVDKGRTWVKLSVTYDSSKVGPPTYSDVNSVGKAHVKAAPERMVWGSNWPHPNETDKPDDAVLFDLLSEWSSDTQTIHRILVENPEVLYGFGKAG